MTASIISIAAGTIPAAITPETAPPASSVCAKPASSVRTVSGARRMRSVSFVAIPSVPSEPTNDAEQVGSVVPHRELDELAVRQHDLGGEDVVDGEAVLEAVRAAGVLGDVAADRADLLRRRVGRVVEARLGDRARDVEVRDARLDDDLPALDVDLEDRASSRASEMTTPSATGSAPPESPVPAPRATNGSRSSAQSRTTACTSAVVPGSATSEGTTRCPVRPSHSYVRNCSGSRIVSVIAANRSSRSDLIHRDSTI